MGSTKGLGEQVSVLESPETVLSTWTSDGKRRWMYPVLSEGFFARRRKIVGWILIILYFALPVVPIGGHPAVLLDFIHREFALFGIIFYPTDTLLLMMTLILIILSVIIGTALLGRVWCGWACPQTVYLEFVYRPIERLIEGKEHVRKRRDDGPLTPDKAWRKVVKYGIYLIISLALAHTFVAYFVGWHHLVEWMLDKPRDHWGFFVLMAGTTGLVMFDFANFREQMCTIACPYARMQSVLLDPDSLIVSYDPTRGEPRARRSKAKLQKEADGVIPAQGDCIDCGACVRTCPTGIDIREGLQMECITCTQCIDACDDIMAHIGKPPGLISYTSENNLAGKRTRLMRPRTILYLVVWLGLAVTLVATLAMRSNYDIDVGRSVGDPYMVLPDGRIANRLRFRVRNQTGLPSSFDIKPVSPANMEIRIVGVSPITLAPGEMKRTEAWVILPRTAFTTDKRTASFHLSFSDNTLIETSFTLLGPSP